MHETPFYNPICNLNCQTNILLFHAIIFKTSIPHRIFHASMLLISKFLFLFVNRQWENELAKARKANRKPRLRNALFQTFWMSCIVDGCLVLIFTMLKSIMPVFLGQLLYQFQVDRNKTSMEFNETTTTHPLIHDHNDDDENIWTRTSDYMLFIWWVLCVVGKFVETWSVETKKIGIKMTNSKKSNLKNFTKNRRNLKI